MPHSSETGSMLEGGTAGMTKHRLEQYAHLRREIILLEKRLEKERIVSDSVKSSSRRPPYKQHVVTITGTDTKTTDRLRRRKQRLTAERAAIEAFVDGLEDSYLRMLITLRYIKGMAWVQVASNAGGNTPSSVRMAVERCFEKN